MGVPSAKASPPLGALSQTPPFTDAPSTNASLLLDPSEQTPPLTGVPSRKAFLPLVASLTMTPPLPVTSVPPLAPSFRTPLPPPPPAAAPRPLPARPRSNARDTTTSPGNTTPPSTAPPARSASAAAAATSAFVASTVPADWSNAAAPISVRVPTSGIRPLLPVTPPGKEKGRSHRRLATPPRTGLSLRARWAGPSGWAWPPGWCSGEEGGGGGAGEGGVGVP